jgi:hypothetical protein
MSFIDPFHPFENPIGFVLFSWLDKQSKSNQKCSVSFEWDKNYILNFFLKMKEKDIISEEFYKQALEEIENLWKNE